jgi:preprotein translocase YajC subunit
MIAQLLQQSTCLFAQEGGKAPVPEGAKSADSTGFFDNPLFLTVGIGLMVVYLFLLLFPGRKEQAKIKAMLDNLKKNDQVLTASGFKGTIVNISEDNPFVTLRIDESTNSKVQVLRSSIARVLTGDEGSKLNEPEKK